MKFMVLFSVLMLLALIMYIPSILYLKFGCFRLWYHDFLGWHKPKKIKRSPDGYTSYSICKYCGKPIIQDLHDGWFVSSELEVKREFIKYNTESGSVRV